MADDAIIQDEPTTAEAQLVDLRALVGNMLGPEQVANLDAGSLRALSTVLLERLMFSRQAGITFHGARDTFEVLGYDRVLTYQQYRARYSREGIAKRIVDAYPVAIWREGAEIYEDEDSKEDTEFMKMFKMLNQKFGIWNRLQRAHTLALLSTYSVILIGAPGDLGDPLPKGSPDKLLYLTPFSGGGGPGGDQLSRSMAMNADCSIQTFETDPSNPRFGFPNTYQLKRTDLSSPLLNKPVHWTRIIHVAHGLLGDEVYGTPMLEAVWNLIDDLIKVTGGGAEAFWLRANAGLHVDIDKTLGMPGTIGGKQNAPGVKGDEKSEIMKKAENLQHQIDRVIVTRGAKVEQLSSPTANFKDPSDAIITQIAGTVGIPKRILVGSEMGQLASGQDKDNWNTQVQDMRTSWAFPSMVKVLLDRLIDYGYLPQPKQKDTYFVDWPIIEDLTEDEKAKMALDLAEVNKAYGSTVFTDIEIRDKCYHMDPPENQLTDQYRAELAVKLTMANKQMGLTIFTDDEIRRICYGFAPLLPEQKVPIGAPERISVAEPPPIDTDDGDAEAPGTAADIANKAKLSPKAMAATIKALEAAIEANDIDRITQILDMQVAA